MCNGIGVKAEARSGLGGSAGHGGAGFIITGLGGGLCWICAMVDYLGLGVLAGLGGVERSARPKAWLDMGWSAGPT